MTHSISAKICKTTFSKEFFNEVWLKLGDHINIGITEIKEKKSAPNNAATIKALQKLSAKNITHTGFKSQNRKAN